MSESKRRWPRRLLIGSLVLGVVGWLGFSVAQSNSDGPLNDIIPGGKLSSGELVTTPVTDWSFAAGKTIELQLEDPAKSRWVGLQVYNQNLYIPCDLGFMWGRMNGRTRDVLHLIYRFKNWHKHAERDGRVVLRIDGKRYPLQATRVTDAAEIAALKLNLEELARGWMAPETLGPEPVSGPRDIWFFRLAPR